MANPSRPLWIALGLLGVGALVSLALAPAPLFRALGVSARTLQAGIGVATAVASFRRARPDGRKHSAGARRMAQRNRLRRAA